MNQQQPSNLPCQRLLQQIRELDFSIVETVLFLDVYPDHPQALEYYGQLVEQRNVLVDRYEKNCGPLTAFSNRSSDSWDWVKTPFPWEKEANITQ